MRRLIVLASALLLLTLLGIAWHLTSRATGLYDPARSCTIARELTDLGKAEFMRILTEPKNALTRQYSALLGSEGVTVEFTHDALEEIAAVAVQANSQMQNIGARRLHTVLETLVEDISFNAPEMSGQTVRIDAKAVREKLKDIIQDEDLSKYIL